MLLMTLFIKLQVFHGASQWGSYCFAKGRGKKKKMPAGFELRVMCWMEEEGDPRLAEEERTAAAPEVESLSCSTCSLQSGGEGPLSFSHTSF